MRHAYLIVAHRPIGELEPLLRLLDDYRNDIFVHLDRGSRQCEGAQLHQFAKKAAVREIERSEVIWGDSSLVDVELRLFREAACSGREYDYYHLISGQDLPLATPDEIDDYFSRWPGTNYVSFAHDPDVDAPESTLDRVNRYWFLQRFAGRSSRGIAGATQRALGRLIQALGVNRLRGRHFSGMHLKKGSNWVSLTHAAVLEILRREDWIRRVTRFTLCSDELYKQTVLWNSSLRSTLSVTQEATRQCENARVIDWLRGDPHIWTESDLDLLESSGAVFARKFDPVVDQAIIEKIVVNVRARQAAV